MGHLFLNGILLSLPYLFEQGMNSGQMEDCLRQGHMSLFIDSGRRLTGDTDVYVCPLQKTGSHGSIRY